MLEVFTVGICRVVKKDGKKADMYNNEVYIGGQYMVNNVVRGGNPLKEIIERNAGSLKSEWL